MIIAGLVAQALFCSNNGNQHAGFLLEIFFGGGDNRSLFLNNSLLFLFFFLLFFENFRRGQKPLRGGSHFAPLHPPVAEARHGYQMTASVSPLFS